MAVLTEDIVHLVLQELVRGRMQRRLPSIHATREVAFDFQGNAIVSWPYSETRSCALVCRTWLNPARRLLYSGIRISSRNPSSLDRLCKTLVDSPALADLVRVVWLADLDGKKASDLLHRLPRLEELHIQQDAVISLEVKPLQQPSLKVLHIHTKVPVHLGKLLSPLATTLECLLVASPHPLGAEKLSFKSLTTLAILGAAQDTPDAADLALFHDCPKLHDLLIAHAGPGNALKALIKRVGSKVTSFQCDLDSHEARRDLWPHMGNLLHLTLDGEVETEDIHHLPKQLHTLKLSNQPESDVVRTILESLATPTFLPCLKAIPHVADADAEYYSDPESYDESRALAPEDIALRDCILVNLRDVRKLAFMTDTLEWSSIWDVDPTSKRSWSPESGSASRHSDEPGCDCDECMARYEDDGLEEMYGFEEWEKDQEYLDFLDSQFGACLAGNDDW